jgi:hypothetical protein
MKPGQRKAALARKVKQAEQQLRLEVQRNAHRLLDGFLASTDPDSQMPMIDVICAHVAVGYGFTVGVSVEHPDAANRVREDPAVTAELAQPKPLIEVVP